MVLISSKGRLGFTFTLQEVEILRAALHRMANNRSPFYRSESKMAAPLAVKMLKRLCEAHAKGLLK